MARLVYSLMVVGTLVGEPTLAQGVVSLGVGLTQPIGPFHDGFLRGPVLRGELGLTASGWDWLVLRAEAHSLRRTFGPGHAALLTVFAGAKHPVASWRLRTSEVRVLPDVALGGLVLDPSERDWTPDFGVQAGVALELSGDPVGTRAYVAVTQAFAVLSYRFVTLGVGLTLR